MSYESQEAGSELRNGVIEPSIWNALAYFSPLIVFPLVFVAAMHGGWWLVGPVVFFWAANNLDGMFGTDTRNMDPFETRESQLFLYKMAVWIWALLWPTTFVFVLWQIFAVGHLATWEALLLGGILAGVAQTVFIVGHELIHRRQTWERSLGEFLLASVSYPHYATEHVYIHHTLVCTPMDVGSAPKGLGFWRYLPREVMSNLVGAWRVERERLARRRLSVWHHTNPFWRYVIETLAWYALVYVMGGPWAVLVFAILCFGVVFSMKISNYLQHYGLQRIRLPNGRYEKALPRHAWSADYKLTNWLYFNMQRHADHHAAANRRYPVLQHHGEDASPQLPGSYAKMFSLALFPRRWFQTMDPLVDRWREQFYPEIDDWSIYDSPAFFARPDAFEAIADILDVSPLGAGWINREPRLLDALQHKEFTDLDLPIGFGPDPGSEAIARRGLTRLYWTRELGVPEMKEQLIEFFPSQNSREAAEVARDWSNHKVFQISMHTIRGNLSPVEAAVALSNLAETTISTAVSAVEEDYLDWHPAIAGGGMGIFPPTPIQPLAPSRTDGGIAIVVLGDLASADAVPGTELDILCVYDGNPVAHYETLCRQILNALRTLSHDNLLLANISRDRRRRSVFSLDDFKGYYQAGDHAGELLELTRARCIFTSGDAGIEGRFAEARREVLSSGAARETLIDQLRDETGDSIAPGVLDVDKMRGGLQAIERAARLLQLTHSEGVPDILAADTISVFQAAGAADIISDSAAEQLSEAMKMWRNLQGILKLVAKEGFTIETAAPKVKAVIAQSCEADDFDSLVAMIDETASQAANALDSIS